MRQTPKGIGSSSLKNTGYGRLLPALLLSLGLISMSSASADDLFRDLKDALGGNGNGEGIDLQRIISSTRKAFGQISDEEELEVGDEAVAVLLGAAPLLDNVPIQRYVNLVGHWVALQTERPKLNWRFGVLDTTDINAFAAPGGYVFITKGLLMRMESEAELAGALAHETVHVLKRHHLVAVQKAAQLDLAVMVAEKQVSDRDRKTLDKITNGFKELYARGLDKKDEFEADRMGIVIATRAGYDPYGLPAVLQNLGAMNPKDGALAFLFKTHPAPDKRLDMLSSLFDKLDPYAAQPQNRERFHKQLASLKGIAR